MSTKPSGYLGSRIKDIKDHLNMTQVYVPWIQLTIGSDGNNKFTIDTASKGNFFVSLQNVKNSDGYANNTTIVLAYVPSAEVGVVDNCGSDIDFLDKLLVSSYGKEILFQYGYSYPDIKSDIYSMTLTKTSVEIQNAILIYTITGVSSLFRYKDASVSIKSFTNVRPTEAFKDVFETYLEQEGYKLVFDEGVEKSDKVVEEIPGSDRITPFQFLSQILGYAVYDGNDTEETKDNERSYYTFSVSDIKDNKEIRVTRICQKDTSNVDTNIIFDWMNGKDDIVLNFTTEFNAMVAIASPYAEEFSTANKFTLDDQGKAVVYRGRSTVESGTKAKQDFDNERFNWAKAVNTSYKAQLQTVGIPVEFSIINDKVRVIPLIYGKAHHTQGIYQILKMTDIINSSGFTTTFELFKLMSDEVEQLYKNGYNKDAIDKAKAAGVYVENKREIVEGTQYGITSSGSGSIYNGTATGQRAKLLQIAAGEMGNTSGAKYWNFVFGSGFSNGNATPWCACFVSWCLNESGLYPSAVNCKNGACQNFRNYFESKNQWQKGKGHGGNYIPNPGDIIIFNWSGSYTGRSGHIGIVKDCDGSTVNTYEGNTSDMCAERSYSITDSDIQGYGVY